VAGTVLGGVVLLFILGSNLVRVGPDRGLWGGGRRGWVQDQLVPSYFFISFVLDLLNRLIWLEVPLGYITVVWFLFLQEQIKDIIIKTMNSVLWTNTVQTCTTKRQHGCLISTQYIECLPTAQ
jgi:hypothetical protein